MFPNTIKDSTGEILTGKLWRKRHGFFKTLPFYSNIPRMEDMATSLQGALGQHRSDIACVAAFVVSKHKFQIIINYRNSPTENKQGSG
jgi:hypothetical protein